MASVALARRSFREFVGYTKSDFIFAPHHELMIRRIEAVMAGEVKRLYIGMPPRHGKSELGSVRLPAYYLGRNPDKQVIHISYSADLSNEFSRQVRSIVRDSTAFRRVFPHVALDPERQKLNDWKLVQGGGFKSVGVQGGVTGHGADFMIIDDPHKEGDADSPKTLEDIFTWFTTAARTRLAPDAPIVFIMTRWHRLDLMGQLLDLAAGDEEADQWEELVLPALAGEDDVLGRAQGEALWRERFDERALYAIRSLDERQFAALFQQNPRGGDVALFAWDDFEMVDTIDEDGEWFWAFDLASSLKETGDYSVYARFRYDGLVLTVSDVHRERREFPEMREHIKRMMLEYPRDKFVFPKHIMELLMMQEVRHVDPARVVAVDQAGDKKERASVLAGLTRQGRVVMVMNTGDARHFVQEHVNFPQDRFDDCVDCSSVAVHHLNIKSEFQAFIKRSEKRLGAGEDVRYVFGQ